MHRKDYRPHGLETHHLTQEKAVAHTLAEHKAIADAMERGDTELVRALVRALVTGHVSGVEIWLRQAL